MRLLEIIGYCIFLVGISFKFPHFPGAPIFMMLGCLLLLIYNLKLLIKKENRNLTVFFTGLASTFWIISLLFRFQYWSFISIPQLIGLGLTIIAIVFFFKNKTFIKIQGTLMCFLFIITTVLAYTPTHKIYYFVNLSEPLNNNYRDDNYRAWDKYSWFLYSAGEYEKALNANLKAIDAANNTIKKDYVPKSILIELNSNKKILKIRLGKKLLTKPIRNAGILLNERSVHLIKSANTLVWLLRMNNLKTKHKALATCRFETFSFQIPHCA